MQVPTISPLLLGSLRGLGVVLLAALLTYMGNTANLPFLSPEVAGIVAALALGIENHITAKTGSALFGAFRV